MKRFSSLLVMVVFLSLMPIVTGIENGYSRMVYNVYEIQNYSLHWNDRFPLESNLSIYAEANGVNHRRAVGVDYIFIIRDSNNNIVDTALYEHRYRNYEGNDFAVYWRIVNKSWEDGFYTTQIHIYDLLNDSIMEKYYDDVTTTLIDQTNESDILPDIPYMNRGFIRNHSELDSVQHKVVIQNFWIDRYADKYPVNRFAIDGMIIENIRVAQKENVSILVNIRNNFYDDGNISVDIFMDGQKISNETTNISAFESKSAIFNVSSSVIGNHTFEIIPTSKNTIGYGLSGSFEVREQEMATFTTFVYKDMVMDNLSVEPNQTVMVSVTIQNIGRPGSLPVNLMINNVPYEEQNIYISSSEEKIIKFNVTEQELGEYRVSINNSGLSKVFFVVSKEQISKREEPVIKKEEGISELQIIVGLSILIILMLTIKIYLKKHYKR